MLLSLLTVEVTEFYKAGDKVGHFLAYFFIILFAAMFLYATVRYVKR